MEFDAFIIGHGVAGASMALELTKRGKSVKVFDLPNYNHCSSVAAGVCNPITGKRQCLSWNATEFFNDIHQFYPEMEKLLNAKFFHPTPVYRILSSVTEVNNWSVSLNDEMFMTFLDADSLKLLDSKKYYNPFETLKVNNGAWLDVKSYLKASQLFFKRLNAYRQIHFNWEEVVHQKHKYHFEQDSAKHIIFCNGLHNSPIWQDFPLIPVKGEILTIKSAEAFQDAIVTGGCFITPSTDNTFRVGSTYDWNNNNLIPTDEAKVEIESKLKVFFKSSFNYISHEVGLRPTTKDRKPILGAHPTLPNIFTFNGLGSKGVSMAPTLASMMHDHIYNSFAIPADIDLKRFL